MATKSILKNISAREPLAGKKLIRAMEAAEAAKGKSSRRVAISRTVHRLERDKIRDFFGEL